jgi:hypothetical protein
MEEQKESYLLCFETSQYGRQLSNTYNVYDVACLVLRVLLFLLVEGV